MSLPLFLPSCQLVGDYSWLVHYFTLSIFFFVFGLLNLKIGPVDWTLSHFYRVANMLVWFGILVLLIQISQACKPLIVKAGFWGSIQTVARFYEIVMGLLLFTPVAFLAWFPFVSEFQTRMLFNQAFSRGLQISRILGGHRKDRSSSRKE